MPETSIIRAVCTAAGWDYCEEHDRPLANGLAPCGYLHRHPQADAREGCMACFDAGLDFDWCRVCGRGMPDDEQRPTPRDEATT